MKVTWSFLLLVGFLYLFFEVVVYRIPHVLHLPPEEPLYSQGGMVFLLVVLLLLLLIRRQYLEQHTDHGVELTHLLQLNAPVIHYLVRERHEDLLTEGLYDVLDEVDEGVGVEVVGLEQTVLLDEELFREQQGGTDRVDAQLGRHLVVDVVEVALVPGEQLVDVPEHLGHLLRLVHRPHLLPLLYVGRLAQQVGRREVLRRGLLLVRLLCPEQDLVELARQLLRESLQFQHFHEVVVFVEH